MLLVHPARATVAPATVRATDTVPAPAPIAPAPSTAQDGAGTVVNDIHSGLNATRVRKVVDVRSVDDVRAAVAEARASGVPLSISGGRHSMGGQAFVTDGIVLDMRGMDRMLEFDAERGTVRVEAGIQWPALIEGLAAHPANATSGEAGYRWSIRQKQTGADRLTIGGAIASNIHGRGLTMKPFIDDVEDITLVDATGTERTVSRKTEPELFRHVVGGYGMFGVVTAATIRLAPRHQVERVVETVHVDDLAVKFQQRIDEGHEFGDFQFDIDPKSPTFLQRGVFSTYRPTGDDERPIPADQKQLSPAEWGKLLYLAHADKGTAFDMYKRHYEATNGQRYWSDTHQMANYADHYHEKLDAALGAKTPGSEMISELYVPRDRLAAFMKDAAARLRELDANVVYGTVRLIEADTESALPWAQKPWASVIFNLHADHTEAGVARVQEQFRSLIDAAADRGGSYYLTYHRWADRDQVQRAHPTFPDVLATKLRYDPTEVFQSDWYRHYRDMFATGSRDARDAARLLTSAA